MDGSQLVVVIPAYCEEATIGKVVSGVVGRARVVVVDDASKDATAELAAAAGATVVRNPTNLGYEGALNAGFAKAAELQSTAILTMDADGEHDPSHVETFARLLLEDGVPLVLGVRPRRQRLAEQVVGAYVWARFGIRDIFCGMKGYHTELWRRHGCFDSRKAVGTELALAAVRGGAPFRQVAVGGAPREDAPRFDANLRANMRIGLAVARAFSAPALEHRP